jgi:hypothetical protein
MSRVDWAPTLIQEIGDLCPLHLQGPGKCLSDMRLSSDVLIPTSSPGQPDQLERKGSMSRNSFENSLVQEGL